MGLEEVQKEILAKAKTDAGRVLAEAFAEADRLRKESQQQFKDYTKQREAEKQKSLEMLERMHRAQLQTEMKMHLMDARRKWIENTFGEVRKKLKNLPDKQRKEHLQKLLKRAANEIDVGTVYCAPTDKKAITGYTVKENEMLGGLIAETSDRTVRVDYSYETMLAQLQENKLAELNKILFG